MVATPSKSLFVFNTSLIMEGHYRPFDVSLTIETALHLENTLDHSAPLAAVFGLILVAGLLFNNFNNAPRSNRSFPHSYQVAKF